MMVPNALSLGDIDLDGLDEIFTIDDGNIYARNDNGTLVNGFPIYGNFFGVPLIANILPPLQGSDIGRPEIIIREDKNIVVISSGGERLYQFASYDTDQSLSLIPYWDGKMALIDGPRLLLFTLDMDHSYWLNSYGRPSGFPLSTGIHEENLKVEFRKAAYNYPNPIINGETTFRFYLENAEISEVRIYIYNAAGYLIEDNLVNSNLVLNEFNEIKWNNIEEDSGLYFAQIKFDNKTSEMIKLVIVR